LRRFVVLLSLIVLLAGLIVARRLVSNWHYILTGDPGELLYIATFDGFADEWNLLGRRMEPVIAGGIIHFEVDDVNQFIYQPTKPYFADFDLRIEGRAVDGPLNNSYGVVFRLRSPENLYMFLVSSDGYYKVMRILDGQEKDLSTWIQSPVVNQGIGATNYLRVVASGTSFNFYINNQPVELCIPNNADGISTYTQGECRDGKMVTTLVDDSFSSGQLGPAVQSLNEPGVVVEFDNLVVYGAEAIEES
jgi:hypothetical protein